MFFNKKSAAFKLIILLALCLPLFAQEVEKELTIDDAVKLAVEGNISLKQSEITLNAAKRASTYSWNSISPTIKGSGSFSKSDSSDFENISVGGSVSVGLSPSLYTSIKSAQLSYEENQITYDAAVRSIELSVRVAFNNLLYDKEKITLQQSNVASAKRQYEANLSKYNQGAISKLDVLSTQVTYKNAELSLENTKVTYENDMSSFKQVLGISQNEKINLKGSLDDALLIKEITLENVEQNSSSIKTLEKQIEEAKTNLLATRFSAWGPTLSASYSYSLATTTTDTSTWNNGGTFSVGASIPLDGYLPWSQGAQSIASQNDTLSKLQLKLEDEKTTVSISVSKYLTQITQAQKSISSYQSSIDLAQQTYEMTLDAYNHGTKDLLSLQNASDNLLEAKVNLKSAENTLVVAVLNLENEIGVQFGTLGK